MHSAILQWPSEPDNEAWEDYELPAQKMLRGSPRHAVQNHYVSDDGRFQIGFWKAEAGCWRVNYTEHEYCEVLQGLIEIRSDNGETMRVGVGDRFAVPAGFQGTWEVLEPACKIYVIYDA